MHKMGRQGDSCCPRCGQSSPNFWHMMWDCSILQDFRWAVVNLLSDILEIDVPLDPLVWLFGILDEELWSQYTRIMLRESLFLARKTIALRWIDRRPPRLNIWKNLVNNSIMYEKLVYVNRRGTSKFFKIWDSWRLSPLTLYPDDYVEAEGEWVRECLLALGLALDPWSWFIVCLQYAVWHFNMSEMCLPFGFISQSNRRCSMFHRPYLSGYLLMVLQVVLLLYKHGLYLCLSFCYSYISMIPAWITWLFC